MVRPSISWNENVKLIVTDVDETIAGVYEPIEPAMAEELSSLLDEGLGILMVSGGGLPQIKRRVIDHNPASLRQKILVGHCNGSRSLGIR